MAPSRPLFGVPSSSIIVASSAPCSAARAPGQRRGDLAVDVGDRPRDALAGPGVAAVAQLDRLELAGRGARGHRGQAARAGLERDLDLDRRVAARVEDLAGVDGGDRAHGRRAVYSRAGGTRRLFAGWRAARFGAAAVRLRAASCGFFGPAGLRALGQLFAFGFEQADRAGQRRFDLGHRRRAASGGGFSGSLRSRPGRLRPGARRP